MPTPLTVTFLVAALVVVVLRLLVPGLPVSAGAGRMSWVDATLFALGGLGLFFHCGAMFYRSTVTALPGFDPLVGGVDALGTASVIAFAIPSLLVLAGLRRLPAPAWALVAASLVAVGVTMYDGGPLTAHLTAITVAVLLLLLAPAAWLQGPTAADARTLQGSR